VVTLRSDGEEGVAICDTLITLPGVEIHNGDKLFVSGLVVSAKQTGDGLSAAHIACSAAGPASDSVPRLSGLKWAGERPPTPNEDPSLWCWSAVALCGITRR
jgi:hypothetical protein